MKMPENIFEYAIENRLRYPYKGSISTEDLYSLSVTELDSIYKTLKKESKNANEESLLETKSEENVVLTVKIEIIKFIVAKKLEKVQVRKEEAKKREQKNKIIEIIAKKQDESLLGKSVEELQKLLEDLD